MRGFDALPSICSFIYVNFLILYLAYDGPQAYDLQNPDNSSTTKIQVLQVTSEHSNTDDLDDDVDEIQTINTGEKY